MNFFLTETPDNPAPYNASAGFILARDGTPLRWAIFRTVVRPHLGTVILLPGRNEPIEKYFETASDLAALGYDIVTADWRGQGFSGRVLANPRPGHVRSFVDYVLDLREVFETVVLPDCRAPFHVLAHSMGGLSALFSAPFLVNQISRIVLSAPLFAFADWPFETRTLRRISEAAILAGFGNRYFTGSRERPVPFAANKLTTDPVRHARNLALRKLAPELALGGPTWRWINAACRAIEKVTDPDFLARVHVPTLMIIAGADEVVSNSAIEDVAGRLRSGSHITIDGARHELMQEADVYRDPFLAAFHAFASGGG